MKNLFVIASEFILVFTCIFLWYTNIGNRFIFDRDLGIIIYFSIVGIIACLCVFFSHRCLHYGSYGNFKFIDVILSIPLGIFISGLAIVIKGLTLFIVIDLQLENNYSEIDNVLSKYMFLLHEISFIPAGFFLSKNIRAGS